MQKKQKIEDVKFIFGSLTPKNPKDVYYFNVEEMLKKYMILALFGAIQIIYFIFY